MKPKIELPSHDPMYDGIIETALSIVADVRRERNLPEPQVERVYHYTTASALVAMAQPTMQYREWSRLWASSLAFMNDSQEFRLGHQTMLSAWNDAIEGLPAGPLRKVMEAAQRAIADDDLHRHALEVFAVCFCADGDLLSQWRGYGDFGKGISVGLNVEKLDFVNAHGFWVLYDPTAQHEVAARIVTELQNRLVEVVNSDNVEEVIFRLIKWLPVFLTFMYSILKHHAFAAEEEYRIVWMKWLGMQGFGTKFRARGAAIIPYVEIDFDRDRMMPLEEVVMGPGAGWPANIASLELFLKTTNMMNAGNQVKIRNSEVPLV